MRDPTKTISPLVLTTSVAWSFLGAWYKWGGNGPSGFDCSGFVCELLQVTGLIPRNSDFSASGLFGKFRDYVVLTPYEGCLCFWENEGKIIHVEYALSNLYSIGASGGSQKTLTVNDAIRDNAFIKIRPIRSRSNIAGFLDPFMLLDS